MCSTPLQLHYYTGVCYKFLISFSGHLVLRHSGVLGLAALVEAYPYTVPDWLPDVVDEISAHLNDPAPINVRLLFLLYAEIIRIHYK